MFNPSREKSPTKGLKQPAATKACSMWGEGAPRQQGVLIHSYNIYHDKSMYTHTDIDEDPSRDCGDQSAKPRTEELPRSQELPGKFVYVYANIYIYIYSIYREG